MSAYQLLSQLVNLVENFEQKHAGKPLTLPDFATFLNNQIAQGQTTATATDIRFGANEQNAMANAYQLDNNIGRLFVYMSRYAKSYIKKTLQGTPLSTAEDFTTLALLLSHQSLSKTELIKLNLLEKTSGTEVLNRLLKAELISQWDDPADKRSKQIAITSKGKDLLAFVFEEMNHVGNIITGDLDFQEKQNLQYLLQRLDDFHYAVHLNKLISCKQDIATFQCDSWRENCKTD